jgi:hypothetical protein
MNNNMKRFIMKMLCETMGCNEIGDIAGLALYKNAEGKHYLTFSAQKPFTIATANATRNWNGTLYYSTDTENWNEWNGSAITSAYHNNR